MIAEREFNGPISYAITAQLCERFDLRSATATMGTNFFIKDDEYGKGVKTFTMWYYDNHIVLLSAFVLPSVELRYEHPKFLDQLYAAASAAIYQTTNINLRWGIDS